MKFFNFYICLLIILFSPELVIAQTLEQQMQRQIQERAIKSNREKNEAESRRASLDRDFATGLKFECGNYMHLFLRGIVYTTFQDWDFSNIKFELEIRDESLGRAADRTRRYQAAYVIESGIFKFTEFGNQNTRTYYELHIKDNLKYTKWNDGSITKENCKYLGGEFSRFDR